MPRATRTVRRAAPKLPAAEALLRAPGLGLLTVTTGGAAQREFLARYSPGLDASEWPLDVKARLRAAKALPPPFFFLGVPSDSGGGVCRGAAHGPAALRARLFELGRLEASRDLGDIACIPQLSHDSILNARQLRASGRALWGTEYRAGWPVSALNLTEETLLRAWKLAPKFRPLVVGGDHSVSGAVFAALARAGKLKDLAVLHIDAHTDLMESRFGIEHCFATWTAHAVRRLKDPARWVQIGVRTSGRTKTEWESRFGLRQLWADELLRQDPVRFADGLVEDWKRRGARRLYVSFDVDGLDPADVSATGTPEPRGLRVEWLRKVLARCTKALPLVGADVMEFAPVLGSKEDAERSLDAIVRCLEALEWQS